MTKSPYARPEVVSIPVAIAVVMPVSHNHVQLVDGVVCAYSA